MLKQKSARTQVLPGYTDAGWQGKVCTEKTHKKENKSTLSSFDHTHAHIVEIIIAYSYSSFSDRPVYFTLEMETHPTIFYILTQTIIRVLILTMIILHPSCTQKIIICILI